MECIKYIPGDLVNQRDDRGHWNIRPLSAFNLVTCINYNGIKPVLLTPEILDKNKWEHKNDVYWKHYPYFDLVIYIEERKLHIASVKDIIYLREVKYIHQLQQCLAGLNLDSNINI